MADEAVVSGELPPEGEPVGDIADVVNEIVAESVSTGDGPVAEAAPETPGPTDTAPAETAPEPTTAQPSADPYRQMFEQQVQANRQLQELVQQLLARQSDAPTGQPAQPGPAFDAYGQPVQSNSGSVLPPLTPEMLAEKLVTSPDDPVVQSLVGIRNAQSILPELVADLQSRKQQAREVNDFNTWLREACPPDQRPKDDAGAGQMFHEFRQILTDEGINGVVPFNTLLKLRQARAISPKAVQQAKQEGYQQGLKKNGAIGAANATSAKPVTKKLGLPEKPSLRQCFEEAMAEAAAASH